LTAGAIPLDTTEAASFAQRGLRPLNADLLLVHAPAVFEFRNRRDIYFPFLGTSGDVPITPLYEYFPVGFKTLQRFLSGRGHEVRLLNLSTLLLRYPSLPVAAVIEALDVRMIGIDLHWMVHVQGSLAVAREIKALRPEIPIVFGGISSTYYAEELVRMPQIDMVMRGYDTHEPMAALLDALKRGGELDHIPNLLRKDRSGEVRVNEELHMPDEFSCGIDWSVQPEAPQRETFPIREVLSTQNAGCAYNCPWCGGSREAFRRIFKRQRAMSRKPLAEVSYEFETMKRLGDIEHYHFYSVGSYNEPNARLQHFLDHVAASSLRSISYEQFHLTPEPVLRHMVQANKQTIITLSPQSHDLRIAKLSGRGVYTNAELERWIEQALEIGVAEIDIWYFVGMPEQDERSVMETVEYCHGLLSKFAGSSVNPMICPMIPFLDPASTFFVNPDDHGYRVFFRTAQQHNLGMQNASIINRINYETRWLSRADLVRVGFAAVRGLMEAKAGTGYLPGSWVRKYNASIDDALEFIGVVHEADCLPSPAERGRALEQLGDEIVRRNHQVLFAGVSNQAFPHRREIGGRWFDEFGWSIAELDAATGFVESADRGDCRPSRRDPAYMTSGTLPSPG
jgi:clorobiocin biosynthesis protein CloN6